MCLGALLVVSDHFSDNPDICVTWSLPILALIHEPKAFTAGHPVEFIVGVQFAHATAAMGANKPIPKPAIVRVGGLELQGDLLAIRPCIADAGLHNWVQHVREKCTGEVRA